MGEVERLLPGRPLRQGEGWSMESRCPPIRATSAVSLIPGLGSMARRRGVLNLLEWASAVRQIIRGSWWFQTAPLPHSGMTSAPDTRMYIDGRLTHRGPRQHQYLLRPRGWIRSSRRAHLPIHGYLPNCRLVHENRLPVASFDCAPLKADTSCII